MSILFSPFRLRGLTCRNRFVFSACEDNLADENSHASSAMVRKWRSLARNRVGLLISGQLFVHPWGRGRKGQSGIHNDDTLPGLEKLVDAVHREGGAVILQLGHAGAAARKAVIGRDPLGPSEGPGKRAMDEGAIREAILAFGKAAARAAKVGADGVQIHAAHGYLISQFLSPFFNCRQDAWGGSEEGRFRLLEAVVTETRKALAPGMALLVKLNTHDHTPGEGVTPPLAREYAKRLAALDIDGIETSCGTSSLSPWHMCRGNVPVQEITRYMDADAKARFGATLSEMQKGVEFREGYNLEATRAIRPVTGRLTLFTVGGWRSVSTMEEAVEEGATDLIAMCRPFIREPAFVNKIQSGERTVSACINCNLCLMALARGLPGGCYRKGLPDREEVLYAPKDGARRRT